MRLLLDVHIALWVFAGDAKVDSLRDTILSPDTQVYISVASWWELAIKFGLDKIDANLSDLRWAAHESGFSELPVTGEHTEQLLHLPPLHKDPFNRLLMHKPKPNPCVSSPRTPNSKVTAS